MKIAQVPTGWVVFQGGSPVAELSFNADGDSRISLRTGFDPIFPYAFLAGLALAVA